MARFLMQAPPAALPFALASPSGRRPRLFKSAIFFAAVLAATPAAAHPKIYSYVDADGTRHYTDVPDNNRYKLLALSSEDMTQSGQHYDPMILARAKQYDSIIGKAVV